MCLGRTCLPATSLRYFLHSSGEVSSFPWRQPCRPKMSQSADRPPVPLRPSTTSLNSAQQRDARCWALHTCDEERKKTLRFYYGQNTCTVDAVYIAYIYIFLKKTLITCVLFVDYDKSISVTSGHCVHFFLRHYPNFSSIKCHTFVAEAIWL